MKSIFGIFLLLLFVGALFAVSSPVIDLEKTSINIPAGENEEATSTPELKEVEEEPVQDLKTEIESLKKSVKEISESVILEPTPTPPPAPPAVKSEEIYAKGLQASLNIFCYDKTEGVYIMGSGAIIHPSGYVLTNAHLATHFTEAGTECVLRRGSPAKNFANAKVVWIPDQTKKIADGEIPMNDAAILKITSMTDGSAVGNLEYFKIDPFYLIKEGERLYSLNYPTEFLGAETALRDANLVFSLGTVEKIVTIDEETSTAEGIYLKGELSAQHGSSGGIFLDLQNGNVVGLFVGLTEGATTADRKQFMFMSSYLERIMVEDKGIGLSAFLASSP